MRVLLKAPFAPYSGWGQDGIGLAMAIQRAGDEPFLLPVELTPPLPLTLAQQLVKPLLPPFDLLLAHVAADRATLSLGELKASPLRVLWSMWEWTTFNNHPAVETISNALHSYDVVVAYDPTSAGAFRQLLPSGTSLLEVQGGFEPEPWGFVERLWRPPIRFLMTGHLSDRKNPTIALEAFTELLEEHGPERFNSELHFKIIDRTNPFLLVDSTVPIRTDDSELLPASARDFVRTAQGRDRVFLHIGTWSRQLMKSFYSRMHCLLAPSRGEAKNLVALEFLSTGGAVIATNFGGHTVWLDESYAYPLRYTLRPATWPIATVSAAEADADINHLKQLMWRVYTDPEEASRKGKIASSVIPIRCDWNAAFHRLLQALRLIGLASPSK